MLDQRPAGRRWGSLLVILAILALPGLALATRGEEAVHAITRDGPARAAVATEAVERGAPCDPAVCIAPVGGRANLGVYDPDGWFKESTRVAVEQFYVRWVGYDSAGFQQKLQEIASRNRWPMVTVEPGPDSPDGATTLLADVASGQYDTEISDLCTTFGDFDRPLFLRWGHEMDLDDSRYAWSGQEPAAYVAAYRHVVDQCRAIAPRVYYVWSPAGNKGADRYWPGGEWADYVGISVFGFPDWDLDHYGHVRGFEENLAEKYGRVASLGRPIMIAELGVVGDPVAQAAWIHDAQAVLARYPQIRTVVYFNAADAEPIWGTGYRPPDWRIDPRVFD